MKAYLKHKNLPWLALGAGVVGMLLRFWQLNTESSRGFIVQGHISGILLFVLTLAFLAVLVIAVRPLLQANKYEFNFPASQVSAIGALAGAACFAINGIGALAGGSLLTGISALIAAAALVLISHCRYKGIHATALAHIAICVVLILRLLSLYRGWCADPQMANYCYPLLATVCLMCSTYHRATFNADFGQRRFYTLFNLAGVYFSCLSIAGPTDHLFYLGAVCWLFTDQCNLTPMPHRFQERDE